MQRIEYSRYGGPEELHMMETPVPTPTKDQILVRMKASSINPVDWKIRAGILKMMTGSKFPKGIGQDFAGVVEAVGPSVTRFKAGDQVFGVMEMKEAAAFADAILTPEHTATLKPATLSDDQAAAIATVGQTAWTTLVDSGKLKARQRVFVNGILGSVGRCAIQVAHLYKAEISGTCGPDGLAEAKALRVAQAVDYHRFDAEQFRGKFDIVLDASGNLTTKQCSTMLNRNGIALHINTTFPKMLGVMFARRNKLVFLGRKPELLAKIAEVAAQGKLTLPISKTVSLSQLIPTIRAMETSGTPKGKVVVSPL